MAHRKFTFPMPTEASLVFDAFHYHCWRAQWDSLVSQTRVDGGAPCPSVGAITSNTGAGLLRGLAMRTQFVQYDRPHRAAASMVGTSFPFTRWAASMQHKADGPGRSVMVYTYTLETGPAALRWAMEPVVDWLFARQTQRRFTRLQHFLAQHADDIVRWQREQA